MNVGLLMSRTARRYPDRLAVVCDSVRRNWSEVDERTNGFAKALSELGVVRGDRVAILLPNCDQYVEVLFGCFKVGAVAVPMNAKLHPNEVVFHVNDARARVLVCHEDNAAQIESIRSQLASTEHCVAVGWAPGNFQSYESRVSALRTNEDQAIDIERDELAWLFYTSGTTGRPKGAMLTHGNLMAMTVGSLADMVPMTVDDVSLHVSPLSHGAGLYLLPRVARGSANIILSRFDPEKALQAIEGEKVTSISSIVPTQIRMLLDSLLLGKLDLSSLQYVVYGGSPMYVDDIHRAVSRLGQVWIQLFGQGESPMTGTSLSRHEHVLDGTPQQRARLESAGTARTDMEVKILDDDDREVPRGERGEICLRGPTVMKGYWDRPEESSQALRNGWLHTGDVGHMDEDGYVYIVDRSKDMIISGGMNIYPREIEEVLQSHEAIHECAVVGVPDVKWGEAAKAVVVLRPGASVTEADLIAFCAEHLSGFKKPKSVDVVAELPKSAYGKILKRELRSLYWKGGGRSI